MLEHTQKEKTKYKVYFLNFIFSPIFLNHFYLGVPMAIELKNFHRILEGGKRFSTKKVGG